MKDKFCETIKTSKKLLRKEMILVVNNLSLKERQRQSDAVRQKLISCAKYQASQRVSIFLSVDNEINTLPIIKDMFARGKEIFIPKYKKKIMEMVKLYSIEDYENLPMTKWKIRQPADDDDSRERAKDLDMIFVPGLAFTKSGQRLGHGMGYYDKYLNMYLESDQRRPWVVGLAFKEQLLDEIPTQEHDHCLDLVLTENAGR